MPDKISGLGSTPSGIIFAKANDIMLSVALVNHLYPYNLYFLVP